MPALVSVQVRDIEKSSGKASDLLPTQLRHSGVRWESNQVRCPAKMINTIPAAARTFLKNHGILASVGLRRKRSWVRPPPGP